MINKMETTKYTATLPTQYINELKELANQKAIQSVNQAIRDALALYIAKTKEEAYIAKMQEASKDDDFIKRTMEIESDFIFSDSEVISND